MDLFFAATSMMIAVPTGIKVFAWSATMWGGAIRLTTAMRFAVAFLIQYCPAFRRNGRSGSKTKEKMSLASCSVVRSVSFMN